MKVDGEKYKRKRSNFDADADDEDEMDEFYVYIPCMTMLVIISNTKQESVYELYKYNAILALEVFITIVIIEL